MIVTVNYKGRFGNNLFQYLAGLLFARQYGGIMASPPPDLGGILEAIPPSWCQPTAAPPGPATRLDDATDIMAAHLPPHTNVHLDGWFQRASYYMPHRDEIKSWFRMPVVVRNGEDLAVHVRLTDYWTNWHDGSRVIEPGWYKSVIEKERYEKLHLFCDDYDDPYLRAFDRYAPVVARGTPAEEFHAMRSFARMVMSNSTFCWWAWFLGRGEKCYTFKSWVKDCKIWLTAFPGATEVGGGFDESGRARLVER